MDSACKNFNENRRLKWEESYRERIEQMKLMIVFFEKWDNHWYFYTLNKSCTYSVLSYTGLVFKKITNFFQLRLSAGVTADRPDTAKALETARQRVANLLKPKSTFENDLFQNFAEVFKNIEFPEFADRKYFDIINRGTFWRFIL